MMYSDEITPLSLVRAASLDELAGLIAEIRGQAGDLADQVDLAYRTDPMPRERLLRLTTRLNALTDLADRVVRGYTEVCDTDVRYPGVLDDLQTYGWKPHRIRHDAEADEPGFRGWRRDWRRGEERLSLWFTGPYALTHAWVGDRGPLTELNEIRGVITSHP